MRVLVACDDEGRRAERVAALLRLEMEAVTGTTLVRAGLDARSARPDLVLVDGAASARAAREAVERVRRALERPTGALLLLPRGATWLRVPLPPDVRPAVVLASDEADDGALLRALEQLRGLAKVETGSVARYGVVLDRRSREARAHDQRVVLTPGEATVLAALLDRPSQVVRQDDLARALHGRTLTDPRTRAAVRAEVESLRAKLELIGVGQQLEALRDLGFRFVERTGRPRPPGRR